MKLTLIAALAAVALSGCNTLNPFAVNPRTTPAAQLVQAEAKAALDRALAARLDYCDIRGTLGADLNVSAAPGAGFNVGGSFTCEPRPWPTAAPTPLREFGAEPPP